MAEASHGRSRPRDGAAAYDGHEHQSSHSEERGKWVRTLFRILFWVLFPPSHWVGSFFR